MVRHRGTLTLVIVVAAALGIAGAAAGLAQSPGEKGKPDSAGLKAKNEAALAWYAGHGIAVETVVKDGYAWLVPTESALRQAAAAKGVAYVPKQKAKSTKRKLSIAELKAKNEAALAWYAGHGIAVETVVKDGYAWLVPTESALRQAAAAKGVAYVPKQKGAWTKGK